MKHLKIYESFEKELTLDLLRLCEYADGMINAINILKKLQDNSSFYNLIYEGKKYNNGKFYYTKLAINNKDAIYVLNHTMMSYDFLKENVNKNIYFTFYNVNVSDENLITLIDINKYNL